MWSLLNCLTMDCEGIVFEMELEEEKIRMENKQKIWRPFCRVKKYQMKEQKWWNSLDYFAFIKEVSDKHS